MERPRPARMTALDCFPRVGLGSADQGRYPCSQQRMPDSERTVPRRSVAQSGCVAQSRWRWERSLEVRTFPSATNCDVAEPEAEARFRLLPHRHRAPICGLRARSRIGEAGAAPRTTSRRASRGVAPRAGHYPGPISAAGAQLDTRSTRG